MDDDAIKALLIGNDRKTLFALSQVINETQRELECSRIHTTIFTTNSELEHASTMGETWNMAFIDIGTGAGMLYVYTVRRLISSIDLLVVADANVSPTTYIKPGIMPAGLIQKPASPATVRSTIRDFLLYVIERATALGTTSSFSLQTKKGTIRLPHFNILYFESRAKHIYIRVNRNEYCYYDTLDRLENTLPSSFMRCHRSFIVNTQRITSIHTSSNSVILDDGSIVPISRTYKAAIRGRFQ